MFPHHESLSLLCGDVGAGGETDLLVVPHVEPLYLGLVRGGVGGAATAGARGADGAHGALPAAQAGGGGGRGLEYDAALGGLNVAQHLQTVIYYTVKLEF